MTAAFTPHQEARVRIIIAEMIGVALRGANDRIRTAQADSAVALDGIAVLSAGAGGADTPSVRRQLLGESPDAS